ncbi:rod shape-determining protein [Aerococcaceae bacterium DSM 111020]|nr:rod shape-determining protein [Aerococcaceae bacterium DSM 111020]
MALFGKQLIAIDMGTTNTLIAIHKKGIALREPSLIAVKKGTNEVVAFGEVALELVGRVSDEYEVIRPIQQGVIDNFQLTKRMLTEYIKKALKTNRIHCEAVISVPSNITKVERKALVDALREIGIFRAMIADEMIVSALGLELDITKPLGQMVLNVGGGKSSAGIISYDAIIQQQTVNIGGDNLDLAIADRVRDHYNLIISQETAEKLKQSLGTASYEEMDAQDSMEVSGLSVATGVPSTANVTVKIVHEAIERQIEHIIKVCKKVFETIQPELASDVLETGIYLTGGTGLLRRLPERLERELGLPVILSKQPFDDPIVGTEKLLQDLRVESKRIERSRR